MRVFVDTNVLFDIFAQREPFRKASCKLMIMQMFGDVEIWTAPQSYLNIFYVMEKAQPASTVQKALAESLERINLSATRHSDVRAALEANWDDAEDALMAISCKNTGADYFLTRDKAQTGFKGIDTPVVTPEEFFALMEQEHGVMYDEIELT